ncbi:MAG: F0F1 ATP synthase subunit B [Eubacterium sp.]
MLKFDWNILWTFINLIIFFVLMRLFLFKPIKRTLDKRKELIDDQFRQADETNSLAEELKQQYEAQLEGVEDEKKQILAKTRESAKNEYNTILDRAHNEADKIKADAKKAADIETEKARRAIKEEIAQLAMETAEKVVGRQASSDVDNEIYNEFLGKGSDE